MACVVAEAANAVLWSCPSPSFAVHRPSPSPLLPLSLSLIAFPRLRGLHLPLSCFVFWFLPTAQCGRLSDGGDITQCYAMLCTGVLHTIGVPHGALCLQRAAALTSTRDNIHGDCLKLFLCSLDEFDVEELTLTGVFNHPFHVGDVFVHIFKVSGFHELAPVGHSLFCVKA
jgi:hypothetical protein